MQVKVTATGRRIEPFDDPPGEVLIHNRTLAQWQAEAFEELGLEVVEAPTGPHLEVPDTLYTTARALGRFMEGAGGKNSVLVLKESFFGKYTTPVQPQVLKVDTGWRFETVRFHSGDEEPYADVIIDPEEEQLTIPLPSYYLGVDKMELGLARVPFMTLHHWVHILWVNQTAMAVEALAVPRWRFFARIFWAIIRAMSLNKYRVLAKLNTLGKKCDIHPTAVVEMSTLGDGVEVGPHARVRFSRLGDGVKVMPGAQVEWSVLGDKVWVGQECSLNHCVLYPEAIANQRLMQLCLLGRQVVTTGGCWSIDLNFEQDIRVPLDGELHSTGQRTLGSAFGHNARIGTGFWMASGRMVPNDYFIIRDPRQVLRKLPEGLASEGPLTVTEGTLVPLSKK